ncbi:MAG: hypothetical protein CL600_14515 [Alteromonas sp.]|nr:hypothetical protein [Alteromonas sp.]
MRERNELYSVDWFYELRLESVYEANSEDCGRVCVEGDNIRDALIRYERIKWPFIAGLIEKHGQEIEAEQRKFRDSLFHAFHTKPANEWIAMVKSTGFLPQIEQESGIAFSKGEGSYEDRKAYSDVLASILVNLHPKGATHLRRNGAT